MYAFAPVALGALGQRDPDRPRSYRMPIPSVLLPVAFVSANLLLYWGGYEYEWKLDIAIGVGLALWFIGAALKRSFDPSVLLYGYWVVPWLAGATLIGHYGEYGGTDYFENGFAGQWTDLVVVIAFGLAMYYWAVATAQPIGKVLAAVKEDEEQIEAGGVLNVPMTS